MHRETWSNFNQFSVNVRSINAISFVAVVNNCWTVYTNANLFLTKRKIENWPIYGQAYFLMVDILVKKGSLQRNGMAAIPKISPEAFARYCTVNKIPQTGFQNDFSLCSNFAWIELNEFILVL